MHFGNMKYRVKKETWIDLNGSSHIQFYPQHKHWWCPWWHNFGTYDTYSDYVSYETLDEAISYVKWYRSEHEINEYIEVK